MKRVIHGMLAGVIASDPRTVDHLEPAFAHLIWFRNVTGDGTDAEVRARATSIPIDEAVFAAQQLVEHGLHEENKATWFSALMSTVACFYGWCKPLDVDNALQWCKDNWRTFIPDGLRVAPRSQFPD